MALNTLYASLRRLSAKACFGWIVGHRAVVILAVFALTLFFLATLPKLVFNTSIYDMVIEDLEENLEYQEFKKVFGGEEIIRVVISGQNVFDELAFKKIERLADSLSKIDGVRRTISLPGVKKAVDLSGNWTMETFRDRVVNVPLFRNNLVSSDQRTTLITLVLADGASHEKILASIQKRIDKEGPNLTLYQMGMPVISHALAVFTEKDFFRLPPITFLMVALILFLLFRNIRDVVLPLVCVTLSLVWTLGFIALTGLSLSILTMIVPVFLIAVGTAYCLHIIAEYRHQLLQEPSSEAATLNTFSTISFPTVLAAGTTVLGLASLFVSRIFAIKTFALFACAGMVSFVIVALTFLPAALSMIPDRRPVSDTGNPTDGPGAISGLSTPSLPSTWTTGASACRCLRPSPSSAFSGCCGLRWKPTRWIISVKIPK